MRKKTKNNEHHNQTNSVLGRLAAEYLAFHQDRKSRQTVKTWAIALSSLQQFLSAQGRHELPDISPSDLEAWRIDLERRKFAPCTLEVFGRAVRHFFHWLEENQRIFLNPAREFVVPRPQRAAFTVLSPEQIQLLMAQPKVDEPCGLRDRAILETVYGTGLLLKNICELRCQDVRENVLYIRAQKRRLPLKESVNCWLKKYRTEARSKLLGERESVDALWLNERGRPISVDVLYQVFRHHGATAGLTGVTSNAVRRACAVHRIQSGAHPIELQLLLGYASLRTLSQYLRLTTTELLKGKSHEKIIPA